MDRIDKSLGPDRTEGGPWIPGFVSSALSTAKNTADHPGHTGRHECHGGMGSVNPYNRRSDPPERPSQRAAHHGIHGRDTKTFTPNVMLRTTRTAAKNEIAINAETTIQPRPETSTAITKGV